MNLLYFFLAKVLRHRDFLSCISELSLNDNDNELTDKPIN